jgi:hypothetical protein
MYGFSPVWTLKFESKLADRANDFVYKGQVCGFSLVCSLKCESK